DGETSVGKVVGLNGHYYVTGSHRYAFRGTYQVRVDVIHGTQAVGVTAAARVVEAAASVPSFQHVANFHNTNGYERTYVWSTINWGDGTPLTYPSAGYGWPYWDGYYYGLYGWYYWGYGPGCRVTGQDIWCQVAGVGGAHLYYDEANERRVVA